MLSFGLMVKFKNAYLKNTYVPDEFMFIPDSIRLLWWLIWKYAKIEISQEIELKIAIGSKGTQLAYKESGNFSLQYRR